MSTKTKSLIMPRKGGVYTIKGSKVEQTHGPKIEARKLVEAIKAEKQKAKTLTTKKGT